MALQDKVVPILEHIKKHRNYIETNTQILDIFNGNLLPYVQKILQSSLSANYYEKIKDRIVPINVMTRITDKVSQVYSNNPQRSAPDAYKDDLAFYEKQFAFNQKGDKADNYSNLFKGYALEPYIHKGIPKLRVLSFDKFLPYSDDKVDPTEMTVFIKFMGKVKTAQSVIRELFYLYSDEEFLAITDDGSMYLPAMEGNDGINPYGVIPFLYGNRGNDKLIPTQDTDQLSLTKLIPTVLTDLGGSILFQCFTIIYGIDLSAENLTMSPNAFWDLKSDKTSDKTPVVGTIKPEADVDKVISYIMTIFSFWLETKGIRVGAMGSLTGSNLASGISKIIDEMDTTQLIIKSMTKFADDEMRFWEMFKKVNNYWVETGQIQTDYKPGIWRDDFEVLTQFDDPQPTVDRKTEVETIKLEQDAGYLDHKTAMEKLYPDLSPEQIDERMELIAQEKNITVAVKEEQPTQPEQTDTEEQPQDQEMNG